MDKFAVPVMIVLAIVAYALIDEQFKKVRQAVPAAQPIKVPGLQVPVAPKFEPFNPLAKAAPPAEDDFTPVPFTDPSGAFKVSFPARKPDRVTFPVLVEGCRVTRYSVDRLGSTFEVAVYDSGWDAAGRKGTAREWLKKCHRDQLDGMNAGEEVAKELTVGNGVPGIAFAALCSKGGRPWAWHGRVYLVGSQLYTASAYGDVNLVNFRAPAFLDTFELTPKASGSAPNLD